MSGGERGSTSSTGSGGSSGNSTPRLSADVKTDGPLTKVELSYLKAVTIKDPDSLHHFFDVVMKMERSKWLYTLETFLIFPALTSSEASARIAESFLKQPDFQEYIFPLFAGDTPLESEADEKKLFGDSMALFTLVHYYHFQTSRGKAANDVKVKDDIPQHLSMFGLLTSSIDALDAFAGWHEDSVMLARLMLMSLLTKMNNTTQNYKHDVLKPEWHNAFDVCAVVEQFIFYRPARGVVEQRDASEKHCGLHVDNDGLCLDLPLVDKLIELLTKHLKVDHLTDMLDQSDKNIAKYQKKWKERGMEWLETFQQISNAFHHLEEAKFDEKEQSDFGHFLAKRKSHAAYSVIKKALQHATERILQAKKREGIVGASRIAGMLMGNKPSHDRTGSGSVSGNAPGLPRSESLTGNKNLIPPSPTHSTSSVTSPTNASTPSASPPPTPGSTTTKLSGSLKINLTSPTGAAIAAAASGSGGSSDAASDSTKPAAEEEKKRDETRERRLKDRHSFINSLSVRLTSMNSKRNLLAGTGTGTVGTPGFQLPVPGTRRLTASGRSPPPPPATVGGAVVSNTAVGTGVAATGTAVNGGTTAPETGKLGGGGGAGGSGSGSGPHPPKKPRPAFGTAPTPTATKETSASAAPQPTAASSATPTAATSAMAVKPRPPAFPKGSNPAAGAAVVAAAGSGGGGKHAGPELLAAREEIEYWRIRFQASLVVIGLLLFRLLFS